MLRCRTERDSSGVKRLVSLRWFRDNLRDLNFLRDMQKFYPNMVVEVYYASDMNSCRIIPVFKLVLEHDEIRELNPNIL